MRPSRRPVFPRARGVVASVALLLTAGCAAQPVAVPAGPPPGEAGRACTALMRALPETLADQARREVSPADAGGAAWGDPPITLVCGAPAPPGLRSWSRCDVAEGVGWFVPDDQLEDQSLDAELTTVGVRPTVRVHLPAAHRPRASAVLLQLGPPIRQTLEAGRPCR